MKAYHIEKAQSPADLPDWLFAERDRGSDRPWLAKPFSAEDLSETSSPPEVPEKLAERPTVPVPVERGRASPFRAPVSREDSVVRGRRANSVARQAPAPASDRSQSRDAMSRLRQLRTAKRTARVRFADADDALSQDDNDNSPVMWGDVLGTAPPRAPMPKDVPLRMPVPVPTVTLSRGGSGRVGLPGSVRVKGA